MKRLDPKIRKMIESLYEEIKKENHENDFRELEKKTAELRDYVNRKMLSGTKKGETGRLTGDNREDAIYPIGELVNDSIRRLESRARGKEGGFFIGTGIEQMDRIIGGFEPGEVVVIGARPSMGKTALMISMMNSITQKSNHAIGFISLELPTHQLIGRIIASEAEIFSPKMRSNHLDEEDWNRIIDSTGNIRRRKIYIVDNPQGSVGNIRNVAERLARDYGISILFIDYLQLIVPFSKKRTRQQETASIMKEIKMLARELRLVVIIASQLNRMAELRSGNKRPCLSDLKNSGSIEEDADKVIFIHRPEVYEIYEDERGNSLLGKAELIIAKNRTGPTGEVRLNFNREYGKFHDAEEESAADRDIETRYREEEGLGDLPF